MILKLAMYFINHKIIMNNILVKNATVNILTCSVVSAALVGLVMWCDVFRVHTAVSSATNMFHWSDDQSQPYANVNSNDVFSMYFPLY